MAEIINDPGFNRDKIEELEILHEEGIKFLNSFIPLNLNWDCAWIDKTMYRLEPVEIIEFLDNKPNPQRKGPPVSEPNVISEYVDRLKIIIERLKN